MKHTIERRLRFNLSMYPKLFYPLYYLSGKNLDLAVAHNTDIVIEGFPRSANSFSVGAFQLSQHHPVSVAHHLHAAAQIIRGARLGIPTILLIRPPVSTVLSLRGLNFQTTEKLGSYHPVLDMSIKIYLIQWIKFYSRVKFFHADYVIGLFSEVTSNFGEVVDKVNHRFSTSFNLFEHTTNQVRAIHEKSGYHAGPSSHRQDLKQRAKRELEMANCEALIDEANTLYKEFVELARQQALAWAKSGVQQL